MTRFTLWLPLALFGALFAVILWGLYRPSDRTVHSTMVDKPLPTFALTPLVPGKPGLSSAAFGGGKPRLLNVFASWCVPCVAEAPQLMALKQAGVEIDGIAIRDTPGAMRDFLTQNGDPYATIGDDRQSAAQLALGSSGVPETFLIDGRGRIAEQHIGDIRADEVPGIIEKLRGLP
jgi:cytochrome c biogenesis protein CcmG/thiol:disulfide interchange protein DsbE